MPNTKDLYVAFQKKQQLKAPVDLRDIAVRVDNEEEALLDLMIQNDLPQVWSLLHRSDAPVLIGQNVKFIPDAKRAGSELKQLLVRKDFKTLNDIVDNFRFNMAATGITTNPEFLRYLETYNVIGRDAQGKYKFKVQIS